MSTKKAVLAAVVGKCRELWEGLVTGSSCAGVAQGHSAADDGGGYFGRSYEFSCSASPVLEPARGSGRRRRLGPRCQLLPCVGGSHSPECAGHDDEIDVLAEEFIRRFREQLRMQLADEQLTSSPPSHTHVASAP
ncbi:hypothetical protein ABZP36_022320 [Zizania latifolia]